MRTQPDAAIPNSTLSHKLNELTAEQVAFYKGHGWVHLPKMFTPEETAELSEHLDWLIENLGHSRPGLDRARGGSSSWTRRRRRKASSSRCTIFSITPTPGPAVTKRKLAAAMADLLDGGPVELHHSTLHVKPPESGHPFPMHQDWAFYKHADDRYCDVLVHLDDTRHENGEIRFLDGSHKLGMLDHVVKDETGKGCTPHLPTDRFKLEDTTAVPAKAGDVVVFNILTIHGSYINTTPHNRRLVRVGYKHPDNLQTEGQSKGRPSWCVWGSENAARGKCRFRWRRYAAGTATCCHAERSEESTLRGASSDATDPSGVPQDGGVCPVMHYRDIRQVHLSNRFHTVSVVREYS